MDSRDYYAPTRAEITKAMEIVYWLTTQDEMTGDAINGLDEYVDRLRRSLSKNKAIAARTGASECRKCGQHLIDAPRVMSVRVVVGLHDKTEYRSVEDVLCPACSPHDVISNWKRARHCAARRPLIDDGRARRAV